MSRQSSSGDNTKLYYVQIEVDDEDDEEKILKKHPISDGEKRTKYDFIAVDEGHHVFGEGDGE